MSRALVLPLLAMLACNGGSDVEPEGSQMPNEPVALELDTDTADFEGLKLRLSETDRSGAGAGGPPAPLPDAKVLSDARVEQLLSRLPEIETAERAAFKLREASKPPPLTGDTVKGTFPPAPSDLDVPTPDAGDLRVVRHGPEGDVPLAPHLSVTFSQPMVAVTSQDEASKTVPVQLTPEPEGAWRWVGTKTLLFDPDPRLPMATEYEVKVPAGTTSALGVALDDDTTWTFRTPPVSIGTWFPNSDGNPVNTPLFLGFDQKVDERILAFIALKTGGQRVGVRAATEAEIETSDAVASLVKAAQPGRFVALMPLEPLEPATNYTFVVGKGAPSAEGPRVTATEQTESFRTYDRLKVQEHGCSPRRGPCDPDGGLWLRFNNALVDGNEHVRVEPPIEGVRVNGQHTWYNVSGALPPRGSVTVVVDADATDAYGQRLGKEWRHTFQIGPARKQLQGSGREKLVLDPLGPRSMSVYSRNHKSLNVQVFKVTPDNYAAVSKWLRDLRYDGNAGQAPVPRTAQFKLAIDTYKEDELVETPIALDAWLDDAGHGQVVVWVEPTSPPTERQSHQRLVTWVQATDIGLTAHVDNDEIIAWATRLSDGAAIEGATVQLLGGEVSATTDAGGVARLGKYKTGGVHALVASKAGDVSLLPSAGQSWWNHHANWAQHDPTSTVRWFTFDDRGMYKPGENMRLKGFVRAFHDKPGAGLAGWSEGTPELAWTARDSSNNLIGKGKATISATGAFDIGLDLPKTPNLGGATLLFTVKAMGNTQEHRHPFQIQEFRRPEFEVSASSDPRPYVLGEKATATVHASYYAGGPLPAAPVTWSVTASPASFSPPGWSGWRFGRNGAFGFGGLGGFGYGLGNARPQNQQWTLQGATDAAGDHHAELAFLGMNPPRAMSVRAQATVQDINRQRWTSSTTMLVHASDQYIGLKTDRGFYAKGKEVILQLVVVDLEGKAREGVSVMVEAAPLVWKRKDGRWQQVAQEAKECTVVSSDDPVECPFIVDEGGSWRITATTSDTQGRATESQLSVWVSGGAQRPDRGVAQQKVELIAAAETYAVGDTAEVLVVAPFVPAEGVWTLQQRGVLHTERFTMTEATTTLRVPITDGHVPNVHLTVDLVGAKPRVDDEGEVLKDKAKQVAYAAGTLSLTVPPVMRTLTAEVRPAKDAVAPGSKTSVEVSVVDAQGKPVQAEVAVIIADEAVLALSDYTLPDPISAFYMSQAAGTSTHHSRQMVVLADPLAVHEPQGLDKGGLGGLIGSPMTTGTATGLGGLGTRGRGAGGGGAPGAMLREGRNELKSEASGYGAANQQAPSQSTAPVALREDFRAMALFSPHVMTNAQGKATVPVDVPDSLTRYRVMVVAMDEGVRFGSGDSTLTARKPLMLRPSPPRFLNFGDKAEIPFVVQNPTDKPVTVDVAVRVDNAQVLAGIAAQPAATPVVSAGRQVVVPAGDRVELRFPVAASLAGTARFQAIAVGADADDAATFEFPVWTPATTEAFATYGEIDEGGIVQPVLAPPDAVTQFGGLEVTTSSTELQALTDALLYLNQYPYECSEQVASRTLANAALKDVLEAFEAEQLPSAEDMRASVSEDMKRLERRQHGNGGFSYWGNSRTWPYPSVHAAHAIVRAKEKGFEPSESMLARSMDYLRTIESHIPVYYSQRTRRTIIAYAVYVRFLAGDSDVDKARWLYNRGLDGLSLEASAWILPVLDHGGANTEVEAILRNLENKVTETASTAEFADRYTDANDYVLLHGNRRTDAVILESLIMVRPKHDLVPKVVRGLLGHRVKGRWSSTQENSFVLLALDRYFRVLEAKEPNFVARVWLGDGFAGEHTFSGRTTERAHIDVPMAWLTDPGGEQKLTLAKEGPGRLYYRLGMSYAPKNLVLEPADHGFAVERVYEGIDDPSDVVLQDDGTWMIRSGARVRVRLTMVAPARRTHVALVDPLPGGFEAQNPSLAITGTLPEDPTATRSRYWWWQSTWYTHQNLRDERAEAFTEQLWAGVHTYSYVAIASTPGEFVVPPAKAEEMYHAETFGRSGTARVVIR